jgi:hypothetical protein
MVGNPYLIWLGQTCPSLAHSLGLSAPTHFALTRCKFLRLLTEIVWCLVSRTQINGRLSFQGLTSSNAAAARRTVASAKRLPIICRPTGRPSRVNPHGTVAAG